MNSSHSSAFSGSSSSRPSLVLGWEGSAISSTSSANSSTEPTAVQRVAKLIHQYEEQLDIAFTIVGELGQALVAAKVEAGLSRATGHQILAAFSQSQLAITQAQERGAAGHRLAERLCKQIGLDITSFGEGYKPPEEGFFTTGEERLRVAA